MMTGKALNKLLDALSQQYSNNAEALAEIGQLHGIVPCADLSRLVEALCRGLQLAFALHPTDTLKPLVGACLDETLSWNRWWPAKTLLTPLPPRVVLVEESDGLFRRRRCALFPSGHPPNSADVQEAIWRCHLCFGPGEDGVNETIAQSDYPSWHAVLKAVDDYLDNHLSEITVYLILSSLLVMVCQYERAANCADGAYKRATATDLSAEAAWAHEITIWCYTVLARHLRESESLVRAEKAYRRLLELKPGDAILWTELGDVLVESRKTFDARRAFEEALQLDPLMHIAWMGVARSHFEEEDLEKAESVLRQGMTKCGEHYPGFYFYLAYICGQTNRQLDEKLLLEKVISIEPNFIKAWFNLGVIHHNLSDHGASVEAFRQAADLGDRYALLYLAAELCICGEPKEAIACLTRLIRGEAHVYQARPLALVEEFTHFRSLALLTKYNLVVGCNNGQLPGTGHGPFDQYLLTVQQVLFEGLRMGELRPEQVIENLLHIATSWCLYGKKLVESGLSREFVREQLYTLEHQVEHLSEEIKMASGLAFVWPELRARIEATSDEEFAHEMLKLEPAWLESVGRAQDQGQIQDLRWRLKGNLWVHLFEYQRQPTADHLERTHYYMELLKGHTILHKLANAISMTSERDEQIWNRYIASLPVKVKRTAVANLQTYMAGLPENTIALSFYFLHREILPTMLIVVILEAGHAPQLKILEGEDRFNRFTNAAQWLKHVHQDVAWQEKTRGTGDKFRNLAGQEQILSGRALIKAVADCQRDRLRDAYGAVLEDVINVENLRGKDLYISPSPEMYDIPFGLLAKGGEFLSDIVNSITIVPIFSLRRFQQQEYLPRQDDLVLYIDPDWQESAELRCKSLANGRLAGVPLTFGPHPSTSTSAPTSEYNQWLQAMNRKSRVHILGHHDVNQWSQPIQRKPNLGQFGRYLYEAPSKLDIDLLALEACWAGTWGDPESLMGIVVSFLASGASQVIASPYALVPSETSGRLFEKIYSLLQTEHNHIDREVAVAVNRAAHSISTGTQSLEDTIPTLWGALQPYAAQ